MPPCPGRNCTVKAFHTRLYIPAPALHPGTRIALSEAHSHFLHTVLRLQPGADILVFNNRDGEALCRITALGKKTGQLESLSLTRPWQPPPRVGLAFALLKKDPTDFLIQKGTELGVTDFYPLLTARTTTRRTNIARLTAQAVEAAEQTGRLDVPHIHPLWILDDFLKAYTPTAPHVTLFCDEHRTGQPIAAALPALRGAVPLFVIGPEGGFTDAERQALHTRQDVRAIHLGARLLRAETAAISAVTCWQVFNGDWSAAS